MAMQCYPAQCCMQKEQRGRRSGQLDDWPANWLCTDISYTMLQALEYKQRILEATPSKADFRPLMTCYLTNNTSPDEVHEAKENGIVAYKLYPAGATTNSSSGGADFQRVIPTLKAMADVSGGPNITSTVFMTGAADNSCLGYLLTTRMSSCY